MTATRLATVLVLALSSSAFGRAGDWTVLVRDGLVQPGDVVDAVVTPPDGVTAVTGRWNERPVPFERGADGRWHALLGIDIAARPGPMTLALTGKGAATPRTHTHVIEVSAKAFRTRRITVDPKFVNPPASALPRIRRDTALLNKVFGSPLGERLWGTGAVRPVAGVSVSGFGVRSVLNGEPRGPHTGQDLRATAGTPVHNPTPGVVVVAQDLYYSGNTVVVDHGQGLFSTMAHLSVIDVTEGERVDTGVVLGKVGATGRVTGPHLHWAVRLHGARVDPLSLLDVLATAPRPAP
ncbi:MAG: M23 family metallopeptidase [Vicinamibacterales bacterium]